MNHLKRENLITSLAIIKTNWDNLRKDYIENFVPFAVEALLLISSQIVTLQDLKTIFLKQFGLDIPQPVIKTIMERMKKYDYIKIENKAYRKICEEIKETDFAKIKESIIREHEALIEKMISFYKENYGESVSYEKSNELLLEFIQLSGIRTLSKILSGEPEKSSDILPQEKKFFVSNFISQLLQKDPLGVQYLEKIIKGSALYTALFYPELGRIQQSFSNVDIYLDTPVLLKALGYTGKEDKEYYQELLNLLIEEGANLKIFTHTLQEIEGVLDAAIHAINNKSYIPSHHGETIRYFIEAGYTQSDVELLLANLHNYIRSLRIKSEEKPPFNGTLGIDEEEFEKTLQEEVRYKRDKTRKHDVDCMTSIYRLRKGQKKYHLERSTAIFLTSNSSLAYSCQKFFNRVFDGPSVPLCIMDHTLVTIAWVKKPLKAPNLPMKMLIAECYAALNPSDSLWKKYIEEIEKQKTQNHITEDEYFMLRYSIEARHELMNITQGDPEVISENKIEAILEKAKKSLRADIEKDLHEEKLRRMKAEQEAAQEKKKIDIERQIQLNHLKNISIGVGKYSSLFLFVIASLLLIICAFAAYLHFSNPFKLIFTVLFILFSIFNILLGFNLINIKRKLGLLISNKTEKLLRRFLGFNKFQSV